MGGTNLHHQQPSDPPFRVAAKYFDWREDKNIPPTPSLVNVSHILTIIKLLKYRQLLFLHPAPSSFLGLHGRRYSFHWVKKERKISSYILVISQPTGELLQFYTSTNLFCSLQKFLGALFVMFAEKIVSTNDIYWVNFVCCAWHWLAAMGPRNMYVIQNRNPF